MTSPLAGRCIDDVTSPSRTWMYGSRLETTITSLPRSSRSRISRSVSGVQRSCSSSRNRCSALEIADERAQIVGDRLQLGVVRSPAPAGASPSPRISARMPCTQPRQLSCAMTTVISEIDHAERDEEVEQVLLRLLRCGAGRSSCRAPSPLADGVLGPNGDTETSSGPCASVRMLARRISVLSRFAHSISRGRVGVAMGLFPSWGRSQWQRDARPGLFCAKNRRNPAGIVRESEALESARQRIRDQARTQVEVAHEPFLGQLVHQRHHRPGERRQDEHEGNDEAEG